jgi:hypothetical protein
VSRPGWYFRRGQGPRCRVVDTDHWLWRSLFSSYAVRVQRRPGLLHRIG